MIWTYGIEHLQTDKPVFNYTRMILITGIMHPSGSNVIVRIEVHLDGGRCVSFTLIVLSTIRLNYWLHQINSLYIICRICIFHNKITFFLTVCRFLEIITVYKYCILCTNNACTLTFFQKSCIAYCTQYNVLQISKCSILYSK